MSNESADKFVYEPLSRVCLPVDSTYPPFAVLAIPLILDVALIILTVFKVFHLVSRLRRPSGAEVVSKFPSLIYVRF